MSGLLRPRQPGLRRAEARGPDRRPGHGYGPAVRPLAGLAAAARRATAARSFAARAGRAPCPARIGQGPGFPAPLFPRRGNPPRPEGAAKRLALRPFSFRSVTLTPQRKTSFCAAIKKFLPRFFQKAGKAPVRTAFAAARRQKNRAFPLREGFFHRKTGQNAPKNFQKPLDLPAAGGCRMSV